MYNNRIIPYNQNVQLSDYSDDNQVGKLVLTAFSVAGLASGAYHGYRRNNSLGWAIWWGGCGMVFPVFTVAVAVAQGFGKPRSS
jgi:hypothetical protein